METYDKEEVRERISLADLYAKEVAPMRRAGTNMVGLCPFHAEKTPSFTVFGGDWREGKCYGCGWAGDIFKFWQDFRGVEFRAALEQLAGLCGVSPRVAGVEYSQRRTEAASAKARWMAKAAEWSRPPLPPLDAPTDAELEALAAMRGLQAGGLRRAAKEGRLWMAEWPLFYRRGEWAAADDPEASYFCPPSRSWVVTDGARWTAQFRRVDGGEYVPRKDGEVQRVRKSWSTKNVSWPLGAGELAGVAKVLLVEGGADMLAAYHFLWGLGIGNVGVCCILGASNRIHESALGAFAGKRVKIVMDADVAKVNERTGVAKAPGMEAAARWQEQLTRAGAAVGVYSLEGLVTASGARVKDLNDLALCSARTIASEEVWGLFFDWNF